MPTLVSSCIAVTASASNNYTATACNKITLSTANNVICIPGNSGPPNYITTTCSNVAGGTSDTLADVAMYYYQTDLRDASLANCNGAASIDFPLGNPDVCSNDVFSSPGDKNLNQHLTTYTLGLGARGRMAYTSKDYAKDTTGDYFTVASPNNPNGILADSTTTPPICSWQASGTVCNWPVPASGSINNIDDLWHAAVNGRGTYFSATDPAALSDGLTSALSSITARVGAAAAAATSTLNPVAGNNVAFVASYTTMKWIGNLEARTIATDTGVISPDASWCVENIAATPCLAPGNVSVVGSGNSIAEYCVTPSTAANCSSPGVFDALANTCTIPMPLSCTGKLPQQVPTPNSDTRTIYTANSTGTSLINFDAAYAVANPTNFSAAHINTLSQWPMLTPTQQAAAPGANLVNYLRGQHGYDTDKANLVGAVDNRIYRHREAVLGDALESQPSYIAAPTFNYADTGYSSFASAQASRIGMVYMGTNDGMLHAFYAQDKVPAIPPAVSTCVVGAVAGQYCGGEEAWAFVPSVVIPNMWHLADTNYDLNHVNFVNGSPLISDYYCTSSCPSGAPEWRTILVGGLNAGGREYYALDITVPTAPILLWEFTPTQNANLGYTFGLPVITEKADHSWVVLITSGYDNGTLSSDGVTNNSPTGDGRGHLYELDAHTGAIINNFVTPAVTPAGSPAGSPATPNGLAKIVTRNNSTASNVAGYTYGGDLLGNVWRFDINAAASVGVNPLLFATLMDPSGVAQPVTASPILGDVNGHHVVFVGTGKYLEKSDASTTNASSIQVQSLYAIKDDYATPTPTLTNPGGSPRNSSTLVQQTLTQTTDANGNVIRTGTSNPVDFGTGLGWYVDFPVIGERVNIDGRLVLGTLLVPTIVPGSSVCSPGGKGWLNSFYYADGSPPQDTSGSGGTATGKNQNVSLQFDASIVGLNILYIGGKPVVEVVTSDNPTPTIPPVQPVFNIGNSNFAGIRMQWRELIP